jgi:glycosyltransferase involved in cell wall biosynthesis
MSKKKILLITHQTSKSGAPYTILLIFKEILKKHNIDLDVFAISSVGELKTDFQEIATNFFYPEKYYGYKKTIYEKALSFLRIRTYKSPFDILKQEISKINYDIIYANTVVAIPYAVEIKNNRTTKIIAHIHELNFAIQECLPDFKNYTKSINFFFVPSNLNKQVLINDFDVDNIKIEIYRSAALPPDHNFELIQDKNIFNVFMCGASNWRKGNDLFLILANSVIKVDNSIHFYWIGNQDNLSRKTIDFELNKLKINRNIHFSGEIKEVYGKIKNMHCFVLTSREDPFPLAAIEAGMAGLPIICFDKVNVINEVLKDKELIVDYLDLEKMKNTILKLKQNEYIQKTISENNKKTFHNFTPDKIALEIMGKIELM